MGSQKSPDVGLTAERLAHSSEAESPRPGTSSAQYRVHTLSSLTSLRYI
jgi:hypothetical protein